MQLACIVSPSLFPVALYRISVHSPVEEMREQAHDKGKLIDRHVTGPFSNCLVLFSRSNSSFSSAPTSVSRFYFFVPSPKRTKRKEPARKLKFNSFAASAPTPFGTLRSASLFKHFFFSNGVCCIPDRAMPMDHA